MLSSQHLDISHFTELSVIRLSVAYPLSYPFMNVLDIYSTTCVSGKDEEDSVDFTDCNESMDVGRALILEPQVMIKLNERSGIWSICASVKEFRLYIRMIYDVKFINIRTQNHQQTRNDKKCTKKIL